jgi:hypothetical protein
MGAQLTVNRTRIQPLKLQVVASTEASSLCSLAALFGESRTRLKEACSQAAASSVSKSDRMFCRRPFQRLSAGGAEH